MTNLPQPYRASFHLSQLLHWRNCSLGAFLLFPLFFSSCGPALPDAVALELEQLPADVDFNQHIRPILSDRCYSCHGPDEKSRQAELRLDQESGLYAELKQTGRTPVVPGSPAKSELVRRILSHDAEVVMPTPESHLTLSAREKALLVRWIEDGAEWKDHWAFLPIADVAVPDNPEGYPTARTPVDNFIHSRLAEEGLEVSEEAEPEVLIRRLYFDLTGLPPTLEELDAWLADPSPEAYAAKVEELLATDAYAERMTTEWLDVARYADSHGLHADGERNSAPYRDWVINAFRQNLSYDTFLLHQLAGDLIGQPTYGSRMATAFLRMHPMTSEGGAIDEEYRLSYVFDRVNTVATGLLGLTMDCARCHDHKFDPLSQEEYYSFSAFFNTIEELGMTANDGDFGPVIQVADDSIRGLLAQYEASIGELGRQRAAVTLSEAELREFAANLPAEAPEPAVRVPFDRLAEGKVDGRYAASGSFALRQDSLRGSVGYFDGEHGDLQIGLQGDLTVDEPMGATVWINTTKRQAGQQQKMLCSTGNKEDSWHGIDFYLDDANHLGISLAHQRPVELIELRSVDSLLTGRWYQVGWTYDGSGLASGVRLYLDGKLLEAEVLHDKLTGSFDPAPCAHWMGCAKMPMRVGRSNGADTGDNGIFRGMMDDMRIYYAQLSPTDIARAYGREPDRQAQQLAGLLRDTNYLDLTRKLGEVHRRRAAAVDTLPRMMVMDEMSHPRQTFILTRGAYDAPGRPVELGTPAAVLPWSKQYAQDRLGLAHWLLSPDNPLTSRVTVNRYWQLFFGQGLVSTPHDFGSQGSLPTHPELLDYLATRFREQWDVRELVRTLVLSGTYRRSSVPTEAQRAHDPENLLLARGARYRLPAEMIRDNALAVSGLLTRRVGGESVRPYQPPGLWFEKLNFSQALLHYVPDEGDKLYRRSMYTFLRRTTPPPFMTTFDATGRDVCLVRRTETNTPLQALNLLNDPQFVEAARVLAQRVQNEGGRGTAAEQLRTAYRLVTGRRAREEELAVLQSLYSSELDRFKADRSAADSLLVVGQFPVDESLEAAHTAALASVSNMLFSLDAAYVKQ